MKNSPLTETMVGILGVHGDSDAFDAMRDSMYWEEWYELVANETGRFSAGMVTHGGKDPAAHVVRSDEDRVGLLFGVIPNRAQLGWSIDETFDRAFERPTETLPKLDGPFVLAVLDGPTDRAIVATDKIGSRPCYYSTADGFSFSSELKSVVPTVPDPHLNAQAVSDLLLVNAVWGEKTLVEDIHSIPPGHFVEFDGGTATTQSYWRFQYGREKGPQYVSNLVDAYRDAMGDVAETIPQPAGVWLSGGLDSRLMAGVVADHLDSFRTYTYERPLAFQKRIGPEDVDLAPKVADALGVPNTNVTLDPDRLVELLPRCIDVVDGMVPWSSLSNLAAVFDRPARESNVLLEASGQSELLGEDMWTSHLDPSNYGSPTEPLLQRHGVLSDDRIRDLLDDSIDPKRTVESAVAESPENRFEDVVMDANNRNLFANAQFLSNKVTRSQTGTRLPFANGRLLDQIADLHPEYRQGTLLFTDGDLPQGYSQIKLELTREFGGELASLPYEQTGVAPKRPGLVHTGGFVVQNVFNRLFATPMLETWYSETEQLREFVHGLLEDAAKRPIWNGAAITDLDRRLSETDHPSNSDRFSGTDGNAMHEAAVVTTVELWAQRHLDEVNREPYRSKSPAKSAI